MNTSMHCTVIDNDILDCPSLKDIDPSLNYNGTVSTTKSGITCQKWTDNTPHFIGYSADLQVIGLGDHNYCRNYENDEDGPWCFTTNPRKQWEYCFCLSKRSILFFINLNSPKLHQLIKLQNLLLRRH